MGMKFAYLSVVSGLLLIAFGLWVLHPTLVAVPGAALVAFGLVGVDVDGG